MSPVPTVPAGLGSDSAVVGIRRRFPGLEHIVEDVEEMGEDHVRKVDIVEKDEQFEQVGEVVKKVAVAEALDDEQEDGVLDIVEAGHGDRRSSFSTSMSIAAFLNQKMV